VIRRPALVALALVAALPLAGCSLAPDTDVVAAVRDETLTRDDLDDILGSSLGQQLLEIPVGVDRFPMGSAQQVINTWVAINGIDPDLAPADEQIAADTAEGFGEQWDTAPQALQELLVRVNEFNAGFTAGTVTEDVLREQLAASPPTIASRFGAWDNERLSVVPLGT
jgi:hypothetical protein